MCRPTWLGALGPYVGSSIGAVDDTMVAWLGVAALVPFTGLLVAFAVARRTPLPGWSAALGRALVASARGGLWLIPARSAAVWRLTLRPVPADA